MSFVICLSWHWLARFLVDRPARRLRGQFKILRIHEISISESNT